MMNSILLVIVVGVLSYLYAKLRYLRFKQYGHFPQLPSSLLWGHLKTLGEFTKRGTHDRHPDKIFEEMWEAKGKPPVMLIDLRPLSPPLLLITTHEIAEQVSRPSRLFPLSPPKSPTYDSMVPIIGMTSIIAQEGHEWKDLRRQYNPGFTTQHLWTLLPLILDKTKPFVKHLDHFVTTNEVFSLETLISNLTFDIIGAAVLGVDLNAQHIDRRQQGELIRLFGDLLRTFHDDKNNLPWWINPSGHYKRRLLSKRIDTLVRDLVRQKHAEAKKARNNAIPVAKSDGVRHRQKIDSIVDLSFQSDCTDTLSTAQLTEASDQVRTFLFAGHDSLTSSLQWAIYELSRTPRALAAVRSELDSLLGPETVDPAAICARLLSHHHDIFPKMRYINAVMKETLRLHPPASTVRIAAPGTGFMIHVGTGTSPTTHDARQLDNSNKSYLTDGAIMYSCQHIIHRDPAVYGDDADKWIPERWLLPVASPESDDAGGDEYDSGNKKRKEIPASAWRPFERGPRNCIGLELANLESRVIIALVARRYDFVKVGFGEATGEPEAELDENGQFKVREELYNTRRMTAKPVDGTLMTVKLAAGTSR